MPISSSEAALGIDPSGHNQLVKHTGKKLQKIVPSGFHTPHQWHRHNPPNEIAQQLREKNKAFIRSDPQLNVGWQAKDDAQVQEYRAMRLAKKQADEEWMAGWNNHAAWLEQERLRKLDEERRANQRLLICERTPDVASIAMQAVNIAMEAYSHAVKCSQQAYDLVEDMVRREKETAAMAKKSQAATQSARRIEVEAIAAAQHFALLATWRCEHSTIPIWIFANNLAFLLIRRPRSTCIRHW